LSEHSKAAQVHDHTKDQLQINVVIRGVRAYPWFDWRGRPIAKELSSDEWCGDGDE
jgi:hypothetical protein